MLGRQGIMSPVKKTRTGDDGRHEALVVLLRTAVDGFDAVTPREIAFARSVPSRAQPAGGPV